LRQYSYFCTSKASEVSTCGAKSPGVSSITWNLGARVAVWVSDGMLLLMLMFLLCGTQATAMLQLLRSQ
jgi:hypothetical protein